MEMDLEIAVLKYFFIKQKRKRYIEFIKGEKRRKEFTNSLAHCIDLKFDSFIEIGSKNIEDKILAQVSHLQHIKSCYAISENDEIDGKRMPIDEALKFVIGSCQGTLLVFGNAEIVYYEGEIQKNRWISK
jgi:hypothetical protein